MAHCHAYPLAARRSLSKQSPGRAPGVEKLALSECRRDLHCDDPSRRSHDDPALVSLDLDEAVAAEQRKCQIGRASCRERVEISVVAVSLKKTKSQQQAFQPVPNSGFLV